MAFPDFLKPLMIKAPETTYFDRLVSEIRSLKTAQAAGRGDAAPTQTALAEAERTFADLKARRDNETIDWNDLYLLEMLLADARPVGALRSKVLSLRRDYRSVAGQVEYDEYLASKPKNLLDPPDPRDPPDKDANYEQLLRDDLKDLLGRLFKRYAILPAREARLRRLTIFASLFCGLFLAILIVFILSMAPEQPKRGGQPASANSNAARESAGGANANDNRAAADTKAGAGVEQGGERTRLPSIALFVVLVSGAMGGFVSALQRIQSSPTEGDSVYNLAMLYHGSYAVFVAPLTGAIFSILLYMMFTGNILTGRFFPLIYTPAARTVLTQASQPGRSAPDTRASGVVNANTNANTNTGNNNARNSNAGNTNNSNTNNANAANSNNSNSNNSNANGGGRAGGADAGNTNANKGVEAAGTETAAASPTPAQVPTASLGVRDFLYQSGPAGGEDYALLIIWSFIAGFAERFVPDSLNRLISSK